ncbi:sugar-transfer associated ATP-grasp domain-containing protein [Sphingomonas sp. YL-JM2C]
MMAGYDRLYYLRKAWPLFPGIVRPVAAPFLAPHYAERRAGRGPLRAAIDALVGLGFHLWIPRRAARVQRRFGLDDAWRRRAIAIARARFADPNDIALFRIEEAAELDLYVRRFEDAAINKRINPLGWTAGCALADKSRFAERCRAAGLPCPETVATVTGGAIEIRADPADRPLIVKPVHGEGGDGLRMLGPVTDGPALRARLRGLRQDMLVQPLIAVHPALADIALGALPTVRIVTMIDEAGAPELVSATFRCASDPRARVDNMKAGGLIVPVALADGALGRACFGYGGQDHDVHPATGAPIAGRTLPDWDAATALVVDAHARAFADYVLIGWDVAFTPRGPLLIEGNGKPGVLMPQRAARRGLGEGRYGALLAHHLATKS